MSIILTNSQFFYQRYGGVTRYSLNLIQKMIDQNINFRICSPIYKNLYLKNINQKLIFGVYVSKFPDLFALKFINNLILNFFLEKKKL